MSPLVPLMLYGWVFFTILLFFFYKPHKAVLISVIGGLLLLPTTTFNYPGLPPYTKNTAIALGLILGGFFSGKKPAIPFTLKFFDLPMILFCLCPIATSLSNNLGLYEGLSNALHNITIFGVPYFAGRIYLNNAETMSDLCLAILIGGIVYILPCLYEIKMSPRLNLNVYGFLPHSWIQHKRYGGWRPMVFMNHGLMVALWMAIASTISFWLWKSKTIKTIKGFPMWVWTGILIITTIFCKSAGAWLALVIGLGSYLFLRIGKARPILLVLILVFPGYTGLRISGIVTAREIENITSIFFDAERTASMSFRLAQEDPIINKALKRPLWGWSGRSRGMPVDPLTGLQVILTVDSIWLILLSKFGFIGLITFFFGLITGPLLVLNSKLDKTKEMQDQALIATVLSIAVLLFLTDCLANGMVNPVYIMISGALASWAINKNRKIGIR